MSMLCILGGLPGTGKSTIARILCERIGATWLRIDTFECALEGIGISRLEMHGKGYELAMTIAADNLRCDRDVIADSVNPIQFTRLGWRNVAEATGQGFLEVEIICSDPAEHQRRVRDRLPDIPGLRLPTWEQVVARHYEPWPEVALQIDTAFHAPRDAVELIVRGIQTR